ncbi:TlpA family protein disulfide reductase [Natronobacterium texcoconense]|uniref:Redoxin n=1 Tax=Natronobacterium texcoconense TaxID=1095778 RepID=A0A1H1IXA7_NATTX|nr:TlpA disulfide reductase family protein [Natronobacterium texcoconense]SDR42341.1 Redoxin [Natronobacterium texcoconense]
MRRREVIAGAAALAATGAGAAYALGGVDPLESDDAIEPIELETLEAPGSDAGTAIVPEPGRVTFLELFATWCDVCERMMEPTGELYDEFGDRIQFVSVSNEPIGRSVTREDVADWWDAHDGRWAVAIDDDLELTSELNASGVPYSFVLDEDNVVTWSDRGSKSLEELREPIAAQLDGV